MAQTHYPLRLLAEDIVGQIGSKDYVSEILAVYYWVIGHVRYANDPRTIELVRSPREVLTRLKANVSRLRSGWRPSLDCLPEDTLLLKKGFEFCRLADLQAGDQIWGLDRWSTVEATIYKGVLPVDAIRLNNGSTFFATADHQAYVEICPKHTDRCACSAAERTRTRMRIGALQKGMVLTQPRRLPFGSQEMERDRAYVEGLYISDGWSQKTSFCISGKDGFPKQKQKQEVAEICARFGIQTKNYEKFLYVADKEWTLRMQRMGSHAPEKHALSIDLGEGAAAGLLRGIMADSGANAHGSGRTFTSTSHLLTLQTRMLHKMFGVNCSERYIPHHGGLGKNPIWRLGVRGARDFALKQLRIKAIDRAVADVPVYDLQTDDHYVYLPQADVTVSNCDDIVALLVALFMIIGREVRILTVAFKNAFYNGKRQFQHVYVQVREPRTLQWIVLDPVAAESTGEMLGRIKAVKIWAVA